MPPRVYGRRLASPTESPVATTLVQKPTGLLPILRECSDWWTDERSGTPQSPAGVGVARCDRARAAVGYADRRPGGWRVAAAGVHHPRRHATRAGAERSWVEALQPRGRRAVRRALSRAQPRSRTPARRLPSVARLPRQRERAAWARSDRRRPSTPPCARRGARPGEKHVRLLLRAPVEGRWRLPVRARQRLSRVLCASALLRSCPSVCPAGRFALRSAGPQSHPRPRIARSDAQGLGAA